MAADLGYVTTLNNWVDQERAASDLLNSISTLKYDKSVELVLFRNTLIDTSVSEILKLHDYAKHFVNKPINVVDTAALAKALTALNIAPARIDIGRLANEYNTEKANYSDVTAFLNDKLADAIDADKTLEPRDVVLFGFGRIGRLLARELVKYTGSGSQLRLRAVVVRKIDEQQLIKRADLLRNDSVHGAFPGTVSVDVEKKAIIVNGQIVYFIEGGKHDEVDYEAYGINNALLLDNTGAFRDREALSGHLKSKGISKVILTAPGKEVPNVVYGINHEDLDVENENVYSAASCTTNAIAPVIKVIEDKFNIVKGHIETVHAYTNDQNLLDNFHKKERRGRSAAINMVITETGAAKAVTKVIPSITNKLTANAVRVPTPNGSLAIMNLTIGRETTLEEVNEVIKDAALNGELVEQINYSIDPELVSNDIIGNECCSVFDSPATIVSPDKKNVVLYTWYDNEFGYTKQVLRLAKHVAQVRRFMYY